MSERKPTEEARVLRSTKIGGYTLLNDEKLGRVIDLMDGIREPSDARENKALLSCKEAGLSTEDTILALYDRLGGAIKFEGRTLRTGTFFDFGRKVARKDVEIGDDDYTDEFVLVRKKQKKGVEQESSQDRLNRVAGHDDSEPEPEQKPEVSTDIPITESAKVLAEQNNIDISTVVGTGEKGKITVSDVRVAIEA